MTGDNFRVGDGDSCRPTSPRCCRSSRGKSGGPQRLGARTGFPDCNCETGAGPGVTGSNFLGNSVPVVIVVVVEEVVVVILECITPVTVAVGFKIVVEIEVETEVEFTDEFEPIRVGGQGGREWLCRYCLYCENGIRVCGRCPEEDDDGVVAVDVVVVVARVVAIFGIR